MLCLLCTGGGAEPSEQVRKAQVQLNVGFYNATGSDKIDAQGRIVVCTEGDTPLGDPLAGPVTVEVHGDTPVVLRIKHDLPNTQNQVGDFIPVKLAIPASKLSPDKPYQVPTPIKLRDAGRSVLMNVTDSTGQEVIPTAYLWLPSSGEKGADRGPQSGVATKINLCASHLLDLSPDHWKPNGELPVDAPYLPFPVMVGTEHSATEAVPGFAKRSPANVTVNWDNMDNGQVKFSEPIRLDDAPGFGAMLTRQQLLHSTRLYTGAAFVAVLTLLTLTVFLPRWREKKAVDEVYHKKMEELKDVDTTRDQLLGQDFGQWTTVKRLGAGGMAVVYLARPTATWDEEESVALKVMNSEVADDPEYCRRFKREIEISGDLNHPNIVHLIDGGDREGRLYLAMEYIRGKTLRDAIPKEGLPVAEALDIVRGMTAGLAHAHKLGVVHRDLKPDNVMLNHKGQVKIMDLGLAKRDENKTAITKTGDTFGTPAYMAPEQIAGGTTPDPRTDQYAVGVMIYELFTGRRPFEEEDSLQMIMKHLQETPPSMREFKPDLPQALADVVARMLAKDPSQRYPNMQAACAAIEEALRGVVKKEG